MKFRENSNAKYELKSRNILHVLARNLTHAYNCITMTHLELKYVLYVNLRTNSLPRFQCKTGSTLRSVYAIPTRAMTFLTTVGPLRTFNFSETTLVGNSVKIQKQIKDLKQQQGSVSPTNLHKIHEIFTLIRQTLLRY